MGIDPHMIGATAAGLAMVSYGIYISGVMRGTVRPHFFTWLIWGAVMSIDAAIKISEKAGAGATVMVFCAAVTLLIAALAYSRGDRHRTTGDWIALGFAALALPVWLTADAPLLSVAIISAIDAAAFYPTFRKSWRKPWEESATSYAVAALQFLLIILALESFNAVTVLYPATICLFNMVLVALLLARRRINP